MSSLIAIDTTGEARIVGAFAQKWDTGRVLAALLDHDDGEYLPAELGLDREAARRECRKPFGHE